MKNSPKVTLSEGSLRHKIWLDVACAALLDYRDADQTITPTERAGLAGYLDCDLSPADAAELYQATSGAERLA